MKNVEEAPDVQRTFFIFKMKKYIREQVDKMVIPRWEHWVAVFLVIVISVVCIARTSSVSRAANSCTSAGAGDWNTVGTWSNCGGTVPQAGDSVTVSHAVTIGAYTINAINNLTIASGGTLTQNNTLAQTISGTLTIQSGGNLTHGYNTNSLQYKVNFLADNIVVDVGGKVDVNYRGYSAGNGPGVGQAGSYTSGGGGHCGAGGRAFSESDGWISGGSANDSVSNISNLGSGGGLSGFGGRGGGLIILTANYTITINGTISAIGSGGGGDATNSGGGGAGGAIKLVAMIIAGTPTSIDARGGDAGADDNPSDDAGGGGGGCFYIDYSVSNSIVTSSAYFSVATGGGTGNGENGADGLSMFNLSQLPVPTAPSGITTSSVSVTSIGVAWTDNSSNETSFVVEKSTDGISFTSASSTNLSVTTTILSNLTPNTSYWFRVAANNQTGSSAYATTTLSTYTQAADPTNLATTTLGASAIGLAFGANNNPNPNTSYYISGNNGFVAITTTTLTPTLSGLTPNTAYNFTVQSVNNNGTRNTSTTISETTLANAPSSFVATLSGSSAELVWTGDASAYYVQNVNTSDVSGWITDLNYTSTGLLCGTTYDFTVKGRNLNGIETATVTSSVTAAACDTGQTRASGGWYNQATTSVNVSRSIKPIVKTDEVSKPSPGQDTAKEIPPAKTTDSATSNLQSGVTPEETIDGTLSSTQKINQVSDDNEPVRPNFTEPFGFGTVGDKVRKLQTILQKLKFFLYPYITGFYGPITTQAVRDYQKAHNLDPVGVVGPATIEALNRE